MRHKIEYKEVHDETNQPVEAWLQLRSESTYHVFLLKTAKRDVGDIEATADVLGHSSARTAWEILESTMSA